MKTKYFYLSLIIESICKNSPSLYKLFRSKTCSKNTCSK